MTDRIFRRGEEAEATQALREQDTKLLFDGRTVVIECVFHTIVDPGILATRLRQACAGPNFRLNVGTIKRRQQDHAILTKTFVNTDESVEEVGARVAALSPKPSHATVGLADSREVAALWAELHRVQDGGD